MVLFLVLLRYFSKLHWTGCFLAQQTLHDLHWILIQAIYLDATKLVFAVLQIAQTFHTINCIVLSFCNL